jgi:uncharacterized protein
MGLSSRLLAARLGFPPAGRRQITADRGLRIHDGVELIADRYRPRGGDAGLLMLMRSPYGPAHGHRHGGGDAGVVPRRGTTLLAHAAPAAMPLMRASTEPGATESPGRRARGLTGGRYRD